MSTYQNNILLISEVFAVVRLHIGGPKRESAPVNPHKHGLLRAAGLRFGPDVGEETVLGQRDADFGQIAEDVAQARAIDDGGDRRRQRRAIGAKGRALVRRGAAVGARGREAQVADGGLPEANAEVLRDVRGVRGRVADDGAGGGVDGLADGVAGRGGLRGAGRLDRAGDRLARGGSGLGGRRGGLARDDLRDAGREGRERRLSCAA